MDIPLQDVITRDNISFKVDAVVYLRVMEADKAVVEVENHLYATSRLAQTSRGDEEGYCKAGRGGEGAKGKGQSKYFTRDTIFTILLTSPVGIVYSVENSFLRTNVKVWRDYSTELYMLYLRDSDHDRPGLISGRMVRIDNGIGS